MLELTRGCVSVRVSAGVDAASTGPFRLCVKPPFQQRVLWCGSVLCAGSASSVAPEAAVPLVAERRDARSGRRSSGSHDRIARGCTQNREDSNHWGTSQSELDTGSGITGNTCQRVTGNMCQHDGARVGALQPLLFVPGRKRLQKHLTTQNAVSGCAVNRKTSP